MTDVTRYWSRTRLAHLCAAQLLVLVYFCIGFYPFELKNPSSGQLINGLTITPDHIWHFRSPGIAYTEGPPVWLPEAIATSSFELSLEVRTTSQEQRGPARIFTVSLNRSRRNLTVGQWGPNLSVRVRTPSTSLDGVPAYGIKNVFADQDWHKINIRIASNTLTISVDGDIAASIALPDQALQGWDPAYRVALGNEMTADKPWLGDIRTARVHIENHVSDYLAAGVLRCPTTYAINNEKGFKLIPFYHDEYKTTVFSDWAVNLLGFLPLGYLVAMIRRPFPGAFLATTLAAGVSLTIESGQFLLFAGRSPSIDDFILNTLGGALGAWLTKKLWIDL
jgi:hypothetical protein